MPWKLLGVLFIIILFIVFAGFNTHRVSLFFGPVELKEVLVFVAMTISFLLGAFITLPFTLISASKKGKLKIEKKKADTPNRKNSKKKRVLTTKKDTISEHTEVVPGENPGKDETII